MGFFRRNQDQYVGFWRQSFLLDWQAHWVAASSNRGSGPGRRWWRCLLGMITAEGPSYGSAITEGTVNLEVYAEILESSLQDTMAYYGFDKKTFRFQQDNARPHTSGATKRWFRRHGYSLDTVLDWPAQSPNLNPIEHVWHQLILRLNKYPTRATTISELEERIERGWYKFTKEGCLKYIDSLPRRINAVIRSRGGPTRY